MMTLATRPKLVRSLFTVSLLLLTAFAHAHAQNGCVSSGSSSCAPEIDPSLATSGTALIAGLALLIRGRRKR
jgi:hypothetical protein